MADNKKYYYMRLRENFFDSPEIALLESMQDGYLYSNILLKLYLRSLRDEGRLMFNNAIPYNAQMIATITRHQVGTIEKALKIFVEMGLIEILDSGAIFMLDIQNYIGKSSTEADRQREYQKRINTERETLPCKKSNKKSGKKSTPEIEIEKEIEIKTELDIHTSSDDDKRASFDYKSVVDSFNKLCTSLPKVQKLTEQRKKAIRNSTKLLEQDGGFTALFERVEASNFLTGRSGDWQCGFDWILKPANLTKILEGNYDNKKSTSSQPDYTDPDRYKNISWEGMQ